MSLYTQKQIPVQCSEIKCPHFETCCKMCTEYYSDTAEVDLLIVGQGCGKVEAFTGRPFVGPAGKRMRQIIVYLWDNYEFTLGFTNNVRCRPTGTNGKDRPPTAKEIGHCSIHLQKDIIQLNPKMIIPVGMSALSTFLDTTDTTMAKEHGRILEYLDTGRNFMPTYHPSYVIRRHGRGSWNEDELTEMDTVVIEDIKHALSRCR